MSHNLPPTDDSESAAKPPLLNSTVASAIRLKRWISILAGVVILTRILDFALSYLDGRWGNPTILDSIVLFLIAVGCMLALGVIALVQRRERRRAAFCLGFSVLVFFSGFMVRPADVFRIGFRHRIQATVTPAELHQIAQACSEILPVDGRLPGPEKSLWEEAEHRKAWDILMKTSAIGKLDASLLIFNHDDEVEIVWGGPLAGHWGVFIERNPGTNRGDIGPGIKTFISSN